MDRKPITFKVVTKQPMLLTPHKIEEMMEQHRTIKRKMLELLTKASNNQITKAVIYDELFKLYQEIK